MDNDTDTVCWPPGPNDDIRWIFQSSDLTLSRKRRSHQSTDSNTFYEPTANMKLSQSLNFGKPTHILWYLRVHRGPKGCALRVQVVWDSVPEYITKMWVYIQLKCHETQASTQQIARYDRTQQDSRKCFVTFRKWDPFLTVPDNADSTISCKLRIIRIEHKDEEKTAILDVTRADPPIPSFNEPTEWQFSWTVSDQDILKLMKEAPIGQRYHPWNMPGDENENYPIFSLTFYPNGREAYAVDRMTRRLVKKTDFGQNFVSLNLCVLPPDVAQVQVSWTIQCQVKFSGVEAVEECDPRPFYEVRDVMMDCEEYESFHPTAMTEFGKLSLVDGEIEYIKFTVVVQVMN